MNDRAREEEIDEGRQKQTPPGREVRREALGLRIKNDVKPVSSLQRSFSQGEAHDGVTWAWVEPGTFRERKQ